MHFYESPQHLDPANLVQLYLTSCTIINLMHDMNASSALMSSSTLYMFHGLMLAATNLLRLLRGLLTQSPEESEKGEATFFQAVTLMKKMSVANDDIPARCADLLSKLWTSQRLFRRPDGTLAPELRIRTRLALSPLVDILWWFREEFKGHLNVYSQLQPSTRPAQGQETDSQNGSSLG